MFTCESRSDCTRNNWPQYPHSMQPNVWRSRLNMSWLIGLYPIVKQTVWSMHATLNDDAHASKSLGSVHDGSLCSTSLLYSREVLAKLANISCNTSSRLLFWPLFICSPLIISVAPDSQLTSELFDLGRNTDKAILCQNRSVDESAALWWVSRWLTRRTELGKTAAQTLQK